MIDREKTIQLLGQSGLSDETGLWEGTVSEIQDLLNRVRNEALEEAAKPLKQLRRLTEEEVKDLPFSIACTHIYYNEAVPDEHSCLEWASAIMDKMIEVNK